MKVAGWPWAMAHELSERSHELQKKGMQPLCLLLLIRKGLAKLPASTRGTLPPNPPLYFAPPPFWERGVPKNRFWRPSRLLDMQIARVNAVAGPVVALR